MGVKSLYSSFTKKSIENLKLVVHTGRYILCT